MEQLQTQADLEKDDKKKKQLIAKLANIQGSFIAFAYSEMKMVRMMDAAFACSSSTTPP